MAYIINEELRQIFIEARKMKKLTILELNTHSKVGIKTIKNLEDGKRDSFSENTIILLCRALDIDMREIVNRVSDENEDFQEDDVEEATKTEENPKDQKPETQSDYSGIQNASDSAEVSDNLNHHNVEQPNHAAKRFSAYRILYIISGLILILAVLISAFKIYIYENNYKIPQYIDYITIEDSLEYIGRHMIIENRWFIAISFFDIKKIVEPGETIHGSIEWKYNHGPDGYPEIFVNMFTDWMPLKENKLFEGVVHGPGRTKEYFSIRCPIHPGDNKIRFFYSMSHGPICSYYGSPGVSTMESPQSAPYFEVVMTVRPFKNIFEKLKVILFNDLYIF